MCTCHLHCANIRRTRDWSIGIGYTRHDGEQILANNSLRFAHRDDQKDWSSSLTGVLNSSRSLNASFNMKLDDQPEAFSFFGRRQAEAKKSKGDVNAVLFWDGERHGTRMSTVLYSYTLHELRALFTLPHENVNYWV